MTGQEIAIAQKEEAGWTASVLGPLRTFNYTCFNDFMTKICIKRGGWSC